jgi:glycosyltransferase involved in cell wall biosynthesis
MKIGITLKQTAYTPEAFAYEKYLISKGYRVQLDFEENLDIGNDINIYFMGARPFWKQKSGCAIEIHEYQSLSVPPYSNLKDCVKKIVNRKPQGRIFLNNVVRNDLGFTDNCPYIMRDMGVDDAFFSSIKKSNEKEYDIVYSGTIDARIGLVNVLHALAIQGYKILVIGNVSTDSQKYLELTHNVQCSGKVAYQELPDLYSKAKYGLNYTPDIYPFNVQTSTKTLEYLASGLELISNRYEWVEQFCIKHQYSPFWLESLIDGHLLMDVELNNNLLNMEEYRWSSILENAQFEEFLLRLLKDNIK